MQRLRWATLLRPGFSRARRAVFAAACVVVISAVLAVVFARSTHEPRTPAEPSSGSSAVRPSISIPPFANWPDAATAGVPVSARSSLKHLTSLDVDKDGANPIARPRPRGRTRLAARSFPRFPPIRR